MGPYKKPLGCSWVGSWGLWLPGSLHGDHAGRESPQLMAKSRKTKDLAAAPASGAEEIGLEGIELGWAGSPQWRPYGTCPPTRSVALLEHPHVMSSAPWYLS